MAIMWTEKDGARLNLAIKRYARHRVLGCMECVRDFERHDMEVIDGLMEPLVDEIEDAFRRIMERAEQADRYEGPFVTFEAFQGSRRWVDDLSGVTGDIMLEGGRGFVYEFGQEWWISVTVLDGRTRFYTLMLNEDFMHESLDEVELWLYERILQDHPLWATVAAMGRE
jgi:hypothetical protein